jgi:hypothetical protein
MFRSKVEYAPEPTLTEPTLEDRFRLAEQQVAEHAALMKKRQDEYADEREMAALQREHWRRLSLYSGLKLAMTGTQVFK